MPPVQFREFGMDLGHTVLQTPFDFRGDFLFGPQFPARVVLHAQPRRNQDGFRTADTRIEAMRLNGMRFLTKQLKGEPLGSETSVNKLHRAALEIEFGELALEIQGSRGALDGEAAVEDGRWQKMSLGWPEVVIGGGTPNIQKNIIAERILGLPKD